MKLAAEAEVRNSLFFQTVKVVQFASLGRPEGVYQVAPICGDGEYIQVQLVEPRQERVEIVAFLFPDSGEGDLMACADTCHSELVKALEGILGWGLRRADALVGGW
jgi:hypothetical protein